jgi:tetrahydrodipicolinate N-succinyltransferase
MLVTNVVVNGITVGDNVIVKFNYSVRDDIDFVVLNNQALHTFEKGPM